MTPTTDLLIGGALATGSVAYLWHGWRRASRHVDEGLALADQPSRDRHPSSLTPRPGSSTHLPPVGAAGPTAAEPGRGAP